MATADYGDLSTNELAKQITDEYSVILANERSNLQKALAVGEKLIALRRRVEHGEWETKLSAYCPTISYETATKYIRIAENWEKIADAAKAKGVATTDLTIDAALKLIAKPKQKKPEDTSKGKPASVVKGGVEPADDPPQRRDEAVAKEWMKPLAVDELVIVLREMFDADYLGSLARALASQTAHMVPLTANAGSAGSFV